MDPRDDPYNKPWTGSSRSSNSELIIILPLGIIASIIAILLLIPVFIQRCCRNSCRGSGCDTYSDYCVQMMGNWKPTSSGTGRRREHQQGAYQNSQYNGDVEMEQVPYAYNDDAQQQASVYTIENAGNGYPRSDMRAQGYSPAQQDIPNEPSQSQQYYDSTPYQQHTSQQQPMSNQQPTSHQQSQQQTRNQAADESEDQAHIKWKHVHTGFAVVDQTQAQPTLTTQKTSQGYIKTYIPASYRRPTQTADNTAQQDQYR